MKHPRFTPEVPKILAEFFAHVRHTGLERATKAAKTARSGGNVMLANAWLHSYKFPELRSRNDYVSGKLLIEDKSNAQDAKDKRALWKQLTRHISKAPSPDLTYLEFLSVVTRCYNEAKSVPRQSKTKLRQFAKQIARTTTKLDRLLKSIGAGELSVKDVLREDPQARKKLDRQARFFKNGALEAMPRLSQFVRLIDRLIQRDMEEDEVPAQQGRAQGDAHLFIRKLNDEFKDMFDHPLHASTAAITRLLFGYSNITEEHVKKLCRMPMPLSDSGWD